MRFRKAVTAETFQLAEGALGEFLGVAVIEHAGDELFLKRVDAACVLEGRHRAAQLIGLGRREASRHHRDLHRLFLKERHAERLAENLFKRGRRILRLFLAFAAPDVGMHHVALNWARAARSRLQ